MLPKNVKGILVDIEGTTTPVSFVYDTLFPYAKAKLEVTCEQITPKSPFYHIIELLKNEYEEEKQIVSDLPEFGNGAPYCHYLMTQDRKSTGLKKLQGIIWEEGYVAGEIKGQIFEDVPLVIKTWQTNKISVRIYSSGSILAQKLLFGYTDYGNLNVYFDGNYDTETGSKKEVDSYRKIANDFSLFPENILFLSDVVEELDAAFKAGLQVGLMVRPGNKPVKENSYLKYSSFCELKHI